MTTEELKTVSVTDISYAASGSKFNYRVCGIMIHDGKILAMRDERSPYYYLPGGRVKMGETAEHAIVREMKEELGVTPHIIRPLWLNQGFFTEDVDQLNYHELCIYFLLDLSDGCKVIDGFALFHSGLLIVIQSASVLHHFRHRRRIFSCSFV